MFDPPIHHPPEKKDAAAWPSRIRGIQRKCRLPFSFSCLRSLKAGNGSDRMETGRTTFPAPVLPSKRPGSACHGVVANKTKLGPSSSSDQDRRRRQHQILRARFHRQSSGRAEGPGGSHPCLAIGDMHDDNWHINDLGQRQALCVASRSAGNGSSGRMEFGANFPSCRAGRTRRLAGFRTYDPMGLNSFKFKTSFFTILHHHQAHRYVEPATRAAPDFMVTQRNPSLGHEDLDRVLGHSRGPEPAVLAQDFRGRGRVLWKEIHHVHLPPPWSW